MLGHASSHCRGNTHPLVNPEEVIAADCNNGIDLAGADKSLGLQHHKGECSYNEPCFNPIVSWIAFE
jgi:hypothetical protein